MACRGYQNGPITSGYGVLALLLDDALVFVVGADPDQDEICSILHCEGAVVKSDPRGPEFSNFLELQRGVRRIFFQQFKITTGVALHRFRKLRQAGPKTGGGAVHSQVLERAFGLFLARFAQQEIELARLRVGLNLLIPFFPVLLGQPAEEFGEFVVRKALDFCL